MSFGGGSKKNHQKRSKLGILKLFQKKGNSPYFYDELFLPSMTMSKNTTFLQRFGPK